MRGRWRSKENVSTGRKDLASSSQRSQFQPDLVTTTDRNSSVGSDEAGRECNQFNNLGAQRDITTRDERNPCRRIASPSVPAFSGETSMDHSLTVVEGRLEQMGVRYQEDRCAPPDHSFNSRLTPSPDSHFSRATEQQSNFIIRVLNHHRILPNWEQWDGLMVTFCDEVHILVPFLHPPSLWALYEEICRCCLHRQSNTDGQSRDGQLQVAHILLCLANGRSVESFQSEGTRSSYSAGWRLYSAARELCGDLLDAFSQFNDQLFLLQTVLLMVRRACRLVSGHFRSLLTGNLSLPS